MIIIIALLMLSIYMVFRNKEPLVPSNVVFLSYLMYFIFPIFLFYFLEFCNWNYILPWGKINDWDKIDIQVGFDYLYVFSLFFFITRFAEFLSFKKEIKSISLYRIDEFWLVVFAFFIGIGLIVFIYRTGGVNSWIYDYSYTYLTKKQGSGLLNYLLIHMSNFLAMLLGLYVFLNKKVSYKIVLFVVLILFFAAFLQGIKSRIFYFAIFSLILPLGKMKITILRGVLIFVSFLLLFSVSMYFRSSGFYSNINMLIEYLLSYFNTAFLHQTALHDLDPDFIGTFGFTINKWFSLMGLDTKEEFFDISAWLSAKYFPEQWYSQSATQQWPVETELYLNFGHRIFWVVPITIYALFLSILFHFRWHRLYLFIYVTELLYFLSVFRGSMFRWISIFNVFVYIILVLFLFVVMKRKKDV